VISGLDQRVKSAETKGKEQKLNNDELKRQLKKTT
jgi:hypothetical protein